MPPQARLTQALYAVSRERQFTPRLCQTRLAFLCLRVLAREDVGTARHI